MKSLTGILSAGLCALTLAACDTGTGAGATGADQVGEAPADAAGASHAAPAVAQQPNPRTMQMWTRSCALCHVDGNAGAPRMGHADEWLPRLVQGRDTLVKHTVEGLNSMPPLGYCMACERDDFLVMIDFMTAGLEDTP